MTTPTVTFNQLCEQIQKKFGFQDPFKLKIKDEEGDLVTMADSDDLDMAISICRAAAAQDMADMGKMEVFVQQT